MRYLILILLSSTALHSQDYDELIKKAEAAYDDSVDERYVAYDA